MTFELTLLGTNAATPKIGRAPSAHALQVQHHYYLIDCGEGTQVRLLETGVRQSRIDQIFITHLHGDHFFGLIGLLTSWQLAGRERPVQVFSPPGLEPMIRTQLPATGGELVFPIDFVAVDTEKNDLIFEDDVVEVFSLPLRHRVPTAGFLFREKRRPANILPEKIEEYDIPVTEIPRIKKGGDFQLKDGRCIPHEELTLPAPAPRAFAYCTDTAYQEGLPAMISGVSLLYHEATFLEDERERAHRTQHSTAREAALVAQKANAERLVLGHFSSRYDDVEVFVEEAEKVFPNVVAGKDGMQIEVPVPERKID